MQSAFRLAVLALAVSLVVNSTAAQDASSRLSPVHGPDDKPFAPEFPVGNLSGSDYLFTNPDAAAAKADITSLWKLQAEGLRQVKTNDGKPALFEAASHFTVGDGLYLRGRVSKGVDALWWVEALVATPVLSGEDKPLPSGELTIFASGAPHLLVKGKSGCTGWRLEKARATRVISFDEVAAVNTILLHAGGEELLASIDDGMGTAESVKLHRVVEGQLKPALIGNKPAIAQEFVSRGADGGLYIGARNEKQWPLFRVTQGVLKPVVMPDGKPVDSDIRFMSVFMGALQFDFREAKEKPCTAWQVRGLAADALKTSAGEQVASSLLSVMPMGEHMLVMAWDEGMSIASLWVHDGKAARPITWADGKQVQGRRPFVAWQDTNFVLRIKDLETWEEKYYTGRDGKVRGPLLDAKGEQLTDQEYATCRSRTGLYMIDFRGKTYGVFRPAFAP